MGRFVEQGQSWSMPINHKIRVVGPHGDECFGAPYQGKGSPMKPFLQLALVATFMIGYAHIAPPAQAQGSAPADNTAVAENAAHARQILKAMSDHIGGQRNVSAKFDLDLEIVTPELQKLAFSSSGHMQLSRPDRIHAWRTGGYSDVELIFDGKTATIYGRHTKTFGQLELPGTVDNLLNELQAKYGMVMPGSDLLVAKPYDELLAGVLDAKYIGRGVIDDVECEHLAFRNFDTDWQLWVELGDRPIPRKYVITSKIVASGPQYTVLVRDWKSNDAPAADAFTFATPTGATRVAMEELHDLDELPPAPAQQARK